MLNRGSGTGIVNPHPDYKVQALSRGAHPHPVTPALAWSRAFRWEHLRGAMKLPQCGRQGCLVSWQHELGGIAAPKSLATAQLSGGSSDVSFSWQHPKG